ncbi:ATP-binding protein [Azospirillum picis]|uniref:histidine kinase n=1 Tax=Azospirillum picis TaxID=488438 RepID=A0ABU0MSL3_9PROT|nr:ATP-binding protein [Azospirillum picis]MBP2302729.1 signal transduction histidine kinase/CheY-like chemotaxis protein/HPt (histidine-containing phosphotransfer) domain-containing protein [Azospirillum picis]MDQ0536480.1 signal transduction histidine kinase/CheY-like chemotaxis protein/HPt (histidine-containing phosphotransfer) domain-containing protein [Azospirillum picis]
MRRIWVLATALSLLMLASLLLLGAVEREKELIRHGIDEELKATATAIQHRLTEEGAFLSGLALSRPSQSGPLRSEDLEQLRRTARFAQQRHPSLDTIAVQDGPSALLDWSARETETSPRPLIGHWDAGKVALQWPLPRNGEDRYVLSALIDTRTFSDLLHAEASPKGWMVAVIDHNLTVIAHSEQTERFVGVPAAPHVAEAIRTGRVGVERRVGADGAATYETVVPLERTGWYLAMSVPDDVATQTYRSVRLMLVGGIGLAVLCGGLAYALFTWYCIRMLDRRTEDLSTRLVDADRRSGEASAFLAMISHELRTPLTAVLGFADLLAKSPLDATQANWVEHQRTAGRALLAIINDILDCSKIEAGALRLERIAFDLPALVGEAATLVRPAADAKGLHMVLDCSPDLPTWVEGDPTRLRQVIGNLLGNAVKFTAAGTVRLALRPTPSPSGPPLLQVAVHDTGIGIPAAKRDRLFRRFSQVSVSTCREYGGTGLGLVICKSLVELMGGEIGADSTEGQGSTFWFTIPLQVADMPAAPAAPCRAMPVPSGRCGNILLVEDNPVTQLLTRTVLEQAGHRVTVADSGSDAVAAVRRGRFGLALMDVHLPGLDGPGATRAIRQMEGGRGSLPIIALTADATSEDAEVCRSAGMDGHLAKPFRPADLLAMIDTHLGRPATELPFPEACGITAKTAPSDAPPKRPAVDDAMQAAMLSAIGESRMAALQAAFVERIDQARQELAAVRQDAGQLIEVAHPLIGAAGMLGFRGVEEAARALCRACRSRDHEQVGPGFALLLDELDLVRRDRMSIRSDHCA